MISAISIIFIRQESQLHTWTILSAIILDSTGKIFQHKHPGGKDCPCPKHEYVREQIKFTKNVHDSGGKATAVTLKFCPDHHRVYRDEVIPSMPFKYRVMTKIALKIGAIRIELLNYMSSDLCFYCKYGSGGYGKKNELPPI